MPNERRALFTKLFYFVLKSDIKFKTFVFEKKQFDNTLKLEGRIAKEMSLFIRSNLEFFQTFDNEILYYDNGQHELNRILNAVLAPRFNVPGIPPGRTIASNPSKSTSDASASVKNVTLWELVTSFLSVIEILRT